MRLLLACTSAVVFSLLVAATLTQRLPLNQQVEILKEGPMRADKVKDGLYVIRGPFLPCMTGCRPGQTGDASLSRDQSPCKRLRRGESRNTYSTRSTSRSQSATIPAR